MRNLEVAQILREIGVLLEIKGENRFRVLAYQEAARKIENWPEAIELLAKEGKLRDISGIGEGLAAKIDEYLRTGKIEYYEELTKETPRELIQLTEIPGVGPKIARQLYSDLGIVNIEQLEQAIQEHRLQNLPGFGIKSEEKIRKGIDIIKKSTGRMLLGYALPLAEEVITFLRENNQIDNISTAGSLRRMKETIGDIDILASTADAERMMETFTKLPMVKQVIAHGTTKSSILTYEGVQIDLRVVDNQCFGAALQYFTGSKEHNVKLREYAQKKGYKINEYGIYRIDDEEKKGGEKEEEIYQILGMEWIPPEMREDQGEIEAALQKRLPVLVDIKDIQGDLHVHSNWSDGLVSIEEMALAATKKGYQYLAICDHTQGLAVASGLTPEQIQERRKEINQWNQNHSEIFVLEGVEANILGDGSIDLPDEVLAQLPIVVAGIHTGLSQTTEKINQRLEKAFKNPYVQIISHPTGRLINKRDATQGDLALLFKYAQQTTTALEINAQPERLDLKDIDARQANEKYQIKLVISTDSHDPSSLNLMRLGVAQARRAWLTNKDILNTYNKGQLLEILQKKRERFTI
ncbi:MAG TPA: DNA polymerase/3'-5' exonuclease PolX [Atribacter sp.]|jgi:DNA polymerase (family 10)|uniref:DNA polymerase/3'-5' exonuclease PolX n=1 Tax=Atribacter sp. TaxID=2847780 RepID=UPI002BB15809|nr:DNA polymerase/3'-5' exonuclease PolX [Atribacter sp.]HQK82620.1 DNA polymerase/3'-5' exonuclease PolX [Atribacter sp.]